MCSKVAVDPKNYTEEGAAKALALKNEWVAFNTETPTSWKAKQSWELRLKAWKERAAEFHFQMGTPIP